MEMTDDHSFPKCPVSHHLQRYKCRHCSDPESWLDSPFDRSETGDLKALSLTSRIFVDIAQQVMFHDVHPIGGTLPLLRTLFERPDLADLVRNFSNDRCTESPVTINIFRTLFVPLAAQFNLHDASGLFDNWLQKIWVNVFERELWMLEFTVALLPWVTALFITVPARRGETKFVLGKLFAKSVTLSSVRYLYLSHHDYRNCKLNLGCLGDLLGMMPRLERLDVNFCGGTTQFLPLYELRSLNLAQSNMTAASLKRLVMSCPKLERFE
ncbi:uncharacterized protein TrAtP1_012292 [Trichoderma atroviride]|uniref:uncharacterized protein n=1 Tax=Hypocrea atroviridis TaxID=63577 RepID=UPI003320248D|nr:hypothetical protein TrAtP1_012292 [Trichoderma atroviride]